MLPRINARSGTMPKHAELIAALRSANLLLGEPAAVALSGGWRIEPRGSSIVSSELIPTYRLRAARVKALPGEHCSELAAAIEEFVHNLEANRGSLGEFLTVRGSIVPHFLIYRLVEGGPILGCMRVRPNEQRPLPGMFSEGS